MTYLRSTHIISAPSTQLKSIHAMTIQVIANEYVNPTHNHVSLPFVTHSPPTHWVWSVVMSFSVSYLIDCLILQRGPNNSHNYLPLLLQFSGFFALSFWAFKLKLKFTTAAVLKANQTKCRARATTTETFIVGGWWWWSVGRWRIDRWRWRQTKVGSYL